MCRKLLKEYISEDKTWFVTPIKASIESISSDGLESPNPGMENKAEALIL